MTEKTESYCYYIGKGSRALEIHDIYRIAYYNQLYYGKRLRKARLLVYCYEISLVVFTLLAFISLLYSGKWSHIVSLACSAVAALTACAKPYIPLIREVDQLSKLSAWYASTFLELESLEGTMRRTNKISQEIEIQFAMIKGKLAIIGEMDDPVMKQPLWDNCKEEGDRAIPIETLWMPEGNCDDLVSPLDLSNHDSEIISDETSTCYCEKELKTNNSSTNSSATPSVTTTKSTQEMTE